jgi:DNA repair ATPase RecN
MTTTTTPDWAAELIALLDQQRRIYHQLGDLSRQQSQLVSAGDAEPLLSLLGQRQQLIDQLTQLNGRIDPYKRDWPALWAQLDRGDRIQQLIDQVQKLLDDIVQQDEKDRVALSAQRQHVADELQQVRHGTAVNRAYGRPTTGLDNNRYTDFQG